MRVKERERHTAYLVSENTESVNGLCNICVCKHAAALLRHLVVLLCVRVERAATPGGLLIPLFLRIQAELNPHFDAFWMFWEEAGK